MAAALGHQISVINIDASAVHVTSHDSFCEIATKQRDNGAHCWSVGIVPF
jgi:hypothetical protein